MNRSLWRTPEGGHSRAKRTRTIAGRNLASVGMCAIQGPSRAGKVLKRR